MADATSPGSSLADYVATLIKEKGFQTLTPEVEAELKKDLLEQLHDTLVAKTLDRLSDQDIKELNTFLDVSPSDEQLQKFIATKIPNAAAFIAEVLLSFRRTYLGLEM